MRGLAWLAVALVLSAGCAQPEDSPDGVDGVGGPQGGNGTVEPPLVGNASVPTVLLGVDVLNGTAPLMVNFTVDATNATSWLLDFGDGNQTNGTVFPSSVNHTFANGTFNVTLQVSGPGGDNATHVMIVADAASVVEALQPFSQSVGLDQPCPGCGDGGTSSCTWRAHGNGNAQDCAWIDFPDELVGQPFTLVGNGLDADLLFWETCNSGVGPKFHGSGNEAGVVPQGMGCVLIWEQLDALVTLTFSITPE